MSAHARCGYATRAKNSPVGTDPVTGKEGYTEAAHRSNCAFLWKDIPTELPQAEREARFIAARRAYMSKLASKRSQKRKSA